MKYPIVCLVVLIAAIAARAAEPPPVGRFQITFKERGLLGLWPEMARRFQWRASKPLDEPYNIAEQTFEASVPAPAEGKKYGLLVWISANEEGAPIREWLPILERRGIIWIGANGSGNEHPPAYRFALAIDAAQNMLKQYNVNPERVYIAGVSGGGRCSSMVAPNYPDLFRGGLYIVGCNYFRSIPVPEEPESEWRAKFRQPLKDLLTLAKERSRIVLLTGEKDMNRAETRAVYENGYRKDGFKHVKLFDVPGMGHTTPDAAWFERAVGALEGE